MNDEQQYNKVIVVDEQNNVIGAEYMWDAIRKGMIRRAARICLFNESGQLLLQQRSEHVRKPLLLDQSAAGHVDEGETNEEAAYRELKEELGIENLPLKLVVDSFRNTSFYSAVYKAVVPDDTEIHFDPGEVKRVMWYDIETFERELEQQPENFTRSLREIWSELRDQLLAKN